MILGVLAAVLVAAGASPAVDEKLELSVLYAGDPTSPRTAAFSELLAEHFITVEAIALHDLTAESARPFDVVVADWKRRHAGGSYDSDARPGYTLPPGFEKPVVMIGAVGGEIARRRSYIDWL